MEGIFFEALLIALLILIIALPLGILLSKSFESADGVTRRSSANALPERSRPPPIAHSTVPLVGKCRRSATT